MKETNTTELFKGSYVTIKYHDAGEGIPFRCSLTPEVLKKISDLIPNANILEDLTLENGVEILLQTPKDHREGCIQGLMFGDGVCRKVAENIVDGIEMTDNEYEILEEESLNERA